MREHWQRLQHQTRSPAIRSRTPKATRTSKHLHMLKSWSRLLPFDSTPCIFMTPKGRRCFSREGLTLKKSKRSVPAAIAEMCVQEMNCHEIYGNSGPIVNILTVIPGKRRLNAVQGTLRRGYYSDYYIFCWQHLTPYFISPCHILVPGSAPRCSSTRLPSAQPTRCLAGLDPSQFPVQLPVPVLSALSLPV